MRRAPTVLLGDLEPIMLVGLRRVLADDGVEVVGEERVPGRIVAEAQRLQPDAVLLDLGDLGARELGKDVQRVAPHAKVILWARDETLMEVLDPASPDARWVATPVEGALRSELTTSAPRPRVEE